MLIKQPTREMGYAVVNQQAADLLRASVEVGIQRILDTAHIRDIAGLDSVLSILGASEKPDLLEALNAVFPVR